ncbi:PilW family protein [Thiolapillus sp.]
MNNSVQPKIYNRQKGISLLSLMVASAIGVFLSGAALKIYTDSKNTFTLRNVVAEVVENQRFALDDMRRILVMAGRDIREADDALPDTNFHTFPPVEESASAAIADGAEFIYDGGAENSDIVAFRYRAGPSCGAYQNVPIQGKLQTRTNGTSYRDDETCRPTTVRFKVVDNDLICEVNSYYTRNDNTGDTTCSSNTPTSSFQTTLISGVQKLKVLYGVDGNPSDGYASQYLAASQVGNWQDIVSIRFALMTSSQSTLPAPARKAEPGSVYILGLEEEEPDTTHLYRVASATLSLRNFNTIVQRQ